MKYTNVTFRFEPNEEFVRDLTANALGEIGFDSFEETTQGMVAYCQTALFDEEAMKQAIDALPIEIAYKYRVEEVPDKDWNAVWEKTFNAIKVNERCLIYNANTTPNSNCEYQIKINPQMAFGSGYHETTRLIISKLLDLSLKNKCVLDMGCGTGILGILTAMRGAQTVTFVDIDEWSVNNTKLNAELNGINDFEVLLGSVEQVENAQFDVILANINRNILLDHLPKYATMLHPNGTLILSGFYIDDCPILRAKAEELGFTFVETKSDNNWSILIFEKH